MFHAHLQRGRGDPTLLRAVLVHLGFDGWHQFLIKRSPCWHHELWFVLGQLDFLIWFAMDGIWIGRTLYKCINFMIKNATTVILQHLVFEICLHRRVPLRSTSQQVSVGKKSSKPHHFCGCQHRRFPPKLLESPAFFLARKASSKIFHGFSIDRVATRSTQKKRS